MIFYVIHNYLLKWYGVRSYSMNYWHVELILDFFYICISLIIIFMVNCYEHYILIPYTHIDEIFVPLRNTNFWKNMKHFIKSFIVNISQQGGLRYEIDILERIWIMNFHWCCLEEIRLRRCQKLMQMAFEHHYSTIIVSKCIFVFFLHVICRVLHFPIYILYEFFLLPYIVELLVEMLRVTIWELFCL